MPQAAAADCSDSVRVAVRIRPQTGAEQLQCCNIVLSCRNDRFHRVPRPDAIVFAGYERVEKCKDCVSANGDMVIIGDRRFVARLICV
jgi:hypothetical protein